MRPVKLALQGFACFREPAEISFEDLDVFVICGPTGAGKSTVIDALCYALYGKVPRGTDVNDLISHDAGRMSVELEFDALKERFRVHRSFNVQFVRGRPVRTVSPVQLEHFDGHAWEGVGDRVRDVDAEIARIVGLDFKGFTRCVVLPQGRFQEFLAGDRRDRRDILVELLDTGIYQRMMQSANAEAAALKNEVDQLERRLREEYADATEEHLARTRTELGMQRESLAVARRVRDAAQEAARFSAQAAEAGRRHAERTQQREKRLQAIDAAERLVTQGEEEQRSRREALALKERALEGAPYDRGAHEKLLQAEPLARAVLRLTKDAATAKAVAEDARGLDAARAAFRVAETAHQEAEAAARTAEEAHTQDQQHYAADFIRAKLAPGDTCPVCGNTVRSPAATHRPDVAAAKKRMEDARAARDRAVASLRTAHGALQAEQTRHEQAAHQAEARAEELGGSLTELRTLVPAGVPAEHAPIAVALQQMNTARQQKEALERDVTTLRKTADDHAASIKAAGDELTGLRAAAAALAEEAASALQEAQEAGERARALALQWEWSDLLAALERGDDPVPPTGRVLSRAQEQVEGLARTVERLERDGERIAQAMVRAAELRAETEEKRARERLYRTLGSLLQANRFQDFVLEEAMQALVETASQHLANLYSRFSLRVAKGEFSVVDHWQADQVRPAATLSGGETFVASLALALALAERLPELRRAAARTLESLFLDEGFGGLDLETLETVIAALEGLRSQGRLVGIITHVPELAKRIESRVEVSKSPSGSSITLVGM